MERDTLASATAPAQGWHRSRAFVCTAALTLGTVGLAVESAWRRADPAGQAFAPSERLRDASLSVVCRPPDSTETLRWDTRPFTLDELEAALLSTDEGKRVVAVRKTYLEVLLRDPLDGDCAGLRTWVDRQTSSREVERHLRSSTEGRRVAAVRRTLEDLTGRDPAGWDNATVRRWTQSALTTFEIRARVSSQRPLVGVYYFAWYESLGPRGWGNGVDLVGSDAPRPSLGWYDSDDPDVLATHLDRIERTGFDFVIVQVIANSALSWQGASRLFTLLEGRRLRAVVILDGLYAAPASDLETWISRASTTFGRHPSYLRVTGVPLFLVYSGRRHVAVPGTTVRNVYWADRYGPGANSYNTAGLLLPHDWPFWAPSPQPLVNGVVPVVPGYSDLHFKDRDRAMEHPRDDGLTYHEQWQRALALRPQFITVYSWNEHFERTAIEPTETWGERYLEWTACYIERAHAGRTGRC